MNKRIAHIALVVRDYDEAIEFYTKKLDFTVLEDTSIDDQKKMGGCGASRSARVYLTVGESS